jgi:uncharacterized protein YndB with AHSA1/START domain
MSKTEFTVVPGQPQVTLRREFDAPRELLFRALTDPELIVQWLGPRELTMTIDRYEPRDGGTYRYVHTGPDGVPHGFRGVFHGTPTADGGIVQTFEYEGVPGHVSLETVTLEEHEGRTTLRNNTVYQSIADRDAHVSSGMEYGVVDSMDRLSELLATLAPAASR